MKTKKKFTFTIENIDHTNLDELYELTIQSNFDSKPIQSTDITHLDGIDDERKYFSYLDESKRERRCLLTMVNLIGNVLGMSTSNECFWCRHPFPYIPIGCPIKYLPTKINKKYFNKITEEYYLLRGYISTKDKEKLKKMNTDDIVTVENTKCFLVDGTFCSFNCCKAFINDNKKNPIYSRSNNLLSYMYKIIFNCENKIKPADHWRLLSKVGGSLSIEQFRNNFYKITHEDLNNIITEIPNMKIISHLYEQHIKF